MGSPLGPTFVNFYMRNLDKLILSDNCIKPNVYCRYVDDIFVVVKNEKHLIALKERMEAVSVLHFTYEMSINDKIPFLDVCIKAQEGQFVCDVFRKQNNDGKLLYAISECPAR